MEWIVVAIYIAGALIAHFIIYRDVTMADAEHQSANITCILWPIALLICFGLWLEKLVHKIL